MSTDHLEPARSVIAKFGVEKVAELTGKHVSRVYRWMYPKDRGGTGGMIPQPDALTLMAFARANGIDLKPADFFEPLTAEKVDELVPGRPAETAA